MNAMPMIQQSAERQGRGPAVPLDYASCSGRWWEAILPVSLNHPVQECAAMAAWPEPRRLDRPLASARALDEGRPMTGQGLPEQPVARTNQPGIDPAFICLLCGDQFRSAEEAVAVRCDARLRRGQWVIWP